MWMLELDSLANTQGNEPPSAWIKAIKHKDLRAYNRLVSLYQDQIYSFAHYLFGNQMAASQAVQEAITLAYRRINHYRSGPFLFWLLHHLVRVFQSQHSCQPSDQLSSSHEFPLENLAPALRPVILLVDMCGLDYHQVSHITGKSLRRISSDIAQARSQLLSKLNYSSPPVS